MLTMQWNKDCLKAKICYLKWKIITNSFMWQICQFIYCVSNGTLGPPPCSECQHRAKLGAPSSGRQPCGPLSVRSAYYCFPTKLRLWVGRFESNSQMFGHPQQCVLGIFGQPLQANKCSNETNQQSIKSYIKELLINYKLAKPDFWNIWLCYRFPVGLRTACVIVNNQKTSLANILLNIAFFWKPRTELVGLTS